MGRLAQRQRQAGAAGQRGGAAARADDHAFVLGARAAGPNLGRAGARRAHRENLVEHDPFTHGSGQRVDARAGTDRAAILVEHRTVVFGGEHREPLGQFGAVDQVCPHAGAAHRLESPHRRRPERDHAVA